jgi:glutathione synthase/RimK-type ligase-like ATP-grasp enzyme
MKKISIGLLYSGKNLGKEEKLFIETAKKHKVNFLPINILKAINVDKLKNRLKNCKLIYNLTAEYFAIEYIKTLEEIGKRVIDSSKDWYYIQDKWIFYLSCRKNNIPTPKTFLIPKNLNIAKKELRQFNKWPIILKRVSGTMGEYVKKADNFERAKEVIRKLLKKDDQKFPLIAQEFIPSPSYRVTMIGKEIAQTAIKDNKHGWKATGVYAKKFEKFHVDKNLYAIIEKLSKINPINVCGIDFLKSGKKWFVLEINSEPSLDFFPEEHESLVEKVILFLKKNAEEIS